LGSSFVIGKGLYRVMFIPTDLLSTAFHLFLANSMQKDSVYLCAYFAFLCV